MILRDGARDNVSYNADMVAAFQPKSDVWTKSRTSDRPTSLRTLRPGFRDPILLDVSRLIWRWWTGRLPTGIDRVCLAYIAHFGAVADAVIQWKGGRIVLTGADARRLMAVLAKGGPGFRRQLVQTLGGSLLRTFVAVPRRGQIYLNIGHSGLDDPSLDTWIARHGLRAIYLVHDLIPIDTPEFCRTGEAEKHVRRMTNALASASGIIVNSNATLLGLSAFATRHGLPGPPMIAAWLAGDTLPAIAPPPPSDRPYFVVVGTIEGRKNHILLLRLWKRLAERMGDARHLNCCWSANAAGKRTTR